MNSLLRKIFYILALAFLFAGMETRELLAQAGKDPTVRIAIVKSSKDVSIEIRGNYRILDPVTGQSLASERKLRRTHIIPGAGGLKVGERSFPLRRIRFEPQGDVTVYQDNKAVRYQGAMDVALTDKQDLMCINRLGLEEYVQGVLDQEVSHHWPLEVLKAQAVISRTYVVYQIQANRTKEYDVTADIYSQVYGGMTSERYQSNLAVERTGGEVLLYHGRLIPAYFHSTCGGYTEDVRELWGHDDDIPPLKGVRCGFCGHSPHSWWKVNLKLTDIEKKLTAADHPVGHIKDIFILERDASGRIRTLEIVDRDEKVIHLSGKDFRDIIGPNLIKSNDYYVVMKGWYADFVGRGWGHGVGLCQWGAHGMSQKGKTYQQILLYYYPGTELVDYRTLQDFPKIIQ